MLAIIVSSHQQKHTHFQQENHNFVKHQVNCGVNLRTSGVLEASHISPCLWNILDGTETEDRCSWKYLDSMMLFGVTPASIGFRKDLAPGISAMQVYQLQQEQTIRHGRDGKSPGGKMPVVMHICRCSIFLALAKIMNDEMQQFWLLFQIGPSWQPLV